MKLTLLIQCNLIWICLLTQILVSVHLDQLSENILLSSIFSKTTFFFWQPSSLTSFFRVKQAVYNFPHANYKSKYTNVVDHNKHFRGVKRKLHEWNTIYLIFFEPPYLTNGKLSYRCFLRMEMEISFTSSEKKNIITHHL